VKRIPANTPGFVIPSKARNLLFLATKQKQIPRVARNDKIIEYHSQCWYGLWYDCDMDPARKITVEIPQSLLEKAQRASGAGITQTIRTGLQLVAASQTYSRLRQLRGKVHFSRSAAELKADR
jgi:hypothetical protein